MKATVSNELKKRLEFASKNGSVVATGILNELKKDKKECFGDKCIDYFDSLRAVGSRGEYKSLFIRITACTKDVNNPNFPDRGNPQAPYFKENRERISLGTFAGLFKNLNYTNDELIYFDSAMCVPDKVKLSVSDKMEDIERAYLGLNYYPFGDSESPLHGSCMRSEETARNAADFYANFAGAKILIAEDSQGQILGRAILWENATIDEFTNIKILDRLYFSFEFIRVLMLNYAKEYGVHLRKWRNSYDTKSDFYALPGFPGAIKGQCRFKVKIHVPQMKWHKKGAPYMDTFSYLCCENGNLVLCNRRTDDCVATLISTSGYGSLEYQLCPKCGRVHNGGIFCDTCRDKLFSDTAFGSIIIGKMKKYKGKMFPACLFEKGKPNKDFSNWIGVRRICDSIFKL